MPAPPTPRVAVVAAEPTAAVVVSLPSAMPRRLPTVPVPAPEESFASWVDRVAVDLALAPGEVARRVGLECRGSDRAVRPVCYGVALTELSARRVGTATGLGEAELRKMQLARYAGGVLDFTGLDLSEPPSVTRLSHREWALFTATRACPQCLREEPVWRVWWRLGIAAVCPVHRVLLVDVCPTCGDRLGLGSAGHPKGLPVRLGILDLGRCNNRRSGDRGRRVSLCDQSLAELPTTAVPMELALLQERLLKIAHGGPAAVAERPVTTAEFFAALRYLTVAARAGAEPGELSGYPAVIREAFAADQGHRRRAFRGGARARIGMSPPSAAHAAAVLALTSQLLFSPSRTALRARLARWQPAVPPGHPVPYCLRDGALDTTPQEGQT